MKNKKLLWLLVLLWALLFVLFVWLRSSHSEAPEPEDTSAPMSESARLEETLSELFRQEMLSNTLNMHYTVADPTKYEITEYTPVLPHYEKAKLSDNSEEQNLLLQTLASFQQELLTARENYTLRLLTSYLELSHSLAQFSYYEEPLSPGSGMQSQLPILLADYTFRTKRDVEDYLALLDQTDEYFDGLLVYEQEKAAAGLLASTATLEKVKTQCDTILTKSALEENSHFLQTTFRERVTKLYKEGLITAKEMQYYIDQNDRLLLTVLLPAYKRLADGLFILEDDSIPLEGLASKPEGREYYVCLLKEQTGSYRDIEDIREMLTDQFALEYQELQRLYQEYPEYAALGYSAEDCDALFSCSTAEEMLEDLQRRMAGDFPAIPDEDSSLPSVTVKAVSESLADYCAPAFYLTPPLDDTDSNVIYINEKSTTSSLELYTTLAHEGYPGHLYQSVYSGRYLSGDVNGPARQLTWYGGYLEGWALYVEFMGYDYASEMMEEQGEAVAAWYVQTEKHNRSLLLCLYSLLDLMIHYDKTSYAQVHQVLEKLGIKNPEATLAVYEYIVEEPANYPKYYLGYLEIQCLQTEARALWNEGYTNMRFHQFLLEYGPADFQTLREELYGT